MIHTYIPAYIHTVQFKDTSFDGPPEAEEAEEGDEHGHHGHDEEEEEEE